jgi:hypothetical protein
MYIKVNGAKVVYDGQIDDLKQTSWHEWQIDLNAFGIDLSNVTELGIGIERTGAFGGPGSILLDDIRLYVATDLE